MDCRLRYFYFAYVKILCCLRNFTAMLQVITVQGKKLSSPRSNWLSCDCCVTLTWTGKGCSCCPQTSSSSFHSSTLPVTWQIRRHYSSRCWAEQWSRHTIQTQRYATSGPEMKCIIIKHRLQVNEGVVIEIYCCHSLRLSTLHNHDVYPQTSVKHTSKDHHCLLWVSSLYSKLCFDWHSLVQFRSPDCSWI